MSYCKRTFWYQLFGGVCVTTTRLHDRWGAFKSCYQIVMLRKICRVDVGMSWGCGYGQPQALEIVDDTKLFRILEDGTRLPLNEAAEAAAAPEVPWWRRQPPRSSSRACCCGWHLVIVVHSVYGRGTVASLTQCSCMSKVTLVVLVTVGRGCLGRDA